MSPSYPSDHPSSCSFTLIIKSFDLNEILIAHLQVLENPQFPKKKYPLLLPGYNCIQEVTFDLKFCFQSSHPTGLAHWC